MAGGMKSCRLRAISCQVRQKLKLATTYKFAIEPAIFIPFVSNWAIKFLTIIYITSTKFLK